MAVHCNPFTSRTAATIGLATGAALMGWGGDAMAQGQLAPLETQPAQLFRFETANHLPARALELKFGFLQTDPRNSAGTGNQNYFLGAHYALSDRLTFGLEGQYYEDPVISPINGAFPAIGLDSIAGSAKYRVYNDNGFAVSLLGSVELFRFETSVFGSQNGSDAEHLIGSISAPITYTMSDEVQFHLTPGVSFFPDDINGNAFYGTVGFVGIGASYNPTDRFSAYASVNVPFGDGGNTITDTAGISNVPVWSVGGRFNVTPVIAVEGYVTNGIGATPATSVLTFMPDGDEMLFGGRIVWTPGRSERYRSSYQFLGELTQRDRDLQQNGFTLASADTYDPGIVAAQGWYGSNENYGGGLVWSPGQHGQIEAYTEQLADDGSVPASFLASRGQRYLVGAKLRFLDQNSGDPMSLSFRVLGGREFDGVTPGAGVIYADAAAAYQPTSRLSLTANPKIAAFRNNTVYGLGLGVNYDLGAGLQLIGEATPVGGDGNGTVWAAGVRYSVPGMGLSLDASASNAVGNNGLGTLIAQDDTKFSLKLTKQFNISGWR